jgi:hypothetical protein
LLKEDARARTILFHMFSTAGGPRDHLVDKGDVDYGMKAGYLFSPLSYKHDTLIRDLILRADASDWQLAASSFLASFGKRRPYLRSFLPSLVVGRRMPVHDFRPGPGYEHRCRICGCLKEYTQDLNVLNFERHMFGGRRHLAPEYIWFCLDRMASEGGATADPADIDCFVEILHSLEALPNGTSATGAEIALRHLRFSKRERLSVIEILAVIGILEDPMHPSFLDQFVAEQHRELPDRRFLDRGYPAEWWRSEYGINRKAVQVIFQGFQLRL